MRRPLTIAALLTAMLGLSGCGGIQSALAPSGTEADEILNLFWTVTVLATVLTVFVLAVGAVALWGRAGWRQVISSDRFVVACGILLPIVVLSFLLVYGLLVMQAGASRARLAEGPGITIVGKRWWWQVIYQMPDGTEVVSANELRLPVGRPTAIHLKTDDVIHSFWAPQLGGKLDMIPGRTNTLTLEATEAGISRAQCAEYCGGAHAMMSLFVVALPPEEYDAWLAAEAETADAPEGRQERRGRRLFVENGCGACHTVRGTDAQGTVGPDLTHVGSRRSLGAATLPNDVNAFAGWIAENQHIKPDNLMPEYDMFRPPQLQALGAYLDGLE